jgi:hypothetical protein
VATTREKAMKQKEEAEENMRVLEEEARTVET